MFIVVGGAPADLAYCRSNLPQAAAVFAGTEGMERGTGVGMVILFRAGLAAGCAERTDEIQFPAVRICGNAAMHTARGEHAVSPADIPQSLLRTTVIARTSWHWNALLRSLAERGGADIANVLPLRSDHVIDVSSFARAVGLTRSGLANRLRLARGQCRIVSVKQLVDWIIVLRLASARHLGATWEEGAAHTGIGLRTVWRVFGRLKRAGYDLRCLPITAVSNAFLDALTSPPNAGSTRRVYDHMISNMLPPRSRSLRNDR